LGNIIKDLLCGFTVKNGGKVTGNPSREPKSEKKRRLNFIIDINKHGI